ncbi:MAG: UvrD-helicase domain-containing protein [Proteobacteria bacterium]|nr:UvrD-helicase domain-containing protein [Pseudomonadota bacterium]
MSSSQALAMTLASSYPYLDALNAPQREAIETLEGPLLILAGAGTGKTRVLTTRIAHLLNLHMARPHEILAVTFTNKAANEMRERLTHLLGREVEGLWLGTFHSLCVRILRRHAERLDLSPSFTILDTDDQLRLMKQLMRAEGIDEKKWPPRVVLANIGRWKDRALTPEKVGAGDVKTPEDPSVQLYGYYQERLEALDALDFGDLILKVMELFKSAPDVLAHYQETFKYLLVDEYQDTNVSQYLWLRLLAMGHRNVCCVGDDDQSIYGWRGAEVSNILRFEKDFPGAKVVRLEENYRSTPHILGAASALIAHNRGRLGKTLWTQHAGGEKVRVQGVWDSQEEARFVASEIENLISRGENLAQIAILVRASFQTREFEDRFMTLGIPYRVVGGARFYERQEIRDALAYLRVVAYPQDGVAFERIINLPRRGIGATTLQTLHHHARAQGISLTQACYDLLDTDELRGKTRTSLEMLLRAFERWRETAKTMSPHEIARIVLDESGYTSMWQEDKSDDAPARLENLKELVRALTEFATLPEFLDHVSLVMDNNTSTEGERVSLMTMHSAKGLEFETVFLPGWEEELFPSPRSVKETGQEGLEEERRLAYVGITRAKVRAFITHAANRCIHGRWQSSQPSRFLDELPKENILTARVGGVKTTHLGWSAASYTQDIVAPASNPYKVGEKVFHIKFGYGHVVCVEGDKLTIDFAKAGTKKVVASFVEKA